MIPSDHFVLFYNEVFKFLDKKGGLEAYYDEVSRHQELHCLELFRSRGLQGVYEYYQKIFKEENCQGEVILNENELILRMDRCPSLSKALDNDAGGCAKYCLHCPGWTAGVYRKAGLFQIVDLMGADKPRCCKWIYDDLKFALKKYRELSADAPKENIFCSFDIPADDTE